MPFTSLACSIGGVIIVVGALGEWNALLDTLALPRNFAALSSKDLHVTAYDLI